MTTAPVHPRPATVGRPRSASGGRLGRAVAAAAVLVSAVGGLSVAGASPAAAAPGDSWGGSFDAQAHHVSVTQLFGSDSRIVSTVLPCGGLDPCGLGDPVGTVVGERGEYATTFTYSTGDGQQNTISVGRDQRDLPIGYPFPPMTEGGVSERQVRTIRGDAYNRWTDAAGVQYVDVHYLSRGQWGWLRFDRARINQTTDGAVFQYNQMMASINRVEAAEVAVGGVGVLGVTADLVLAGSGRMDPLTAVFAMCGIAVTTCTAARQRYTSGDASSDAVEWLYSHGYGYRPDQTTDL
jgi:hypothetical protein